MNRYESRVNPTRFGYPHDRDYGDERSDRGMGMRDDQRAGNGGGPTQGDYRGGYPSNGPDRGWGPGPSWTRDDHEGFRGPGASFRDPREVRDFGDSRDFQERGQGFHDRGERYRDREGRFGTTYGMSQGSNRDFGRESYDDAHLRNAGSGTSYGYQDNEGWGGRGLEEMRGASGHETYDPRYSRQDARRFGGQQRFGQGWESDQFQSHNRSSNTFSPYDPSGSSSGAGRGGWDRDDRFGQPHQGGQMGQSRQMGQGGRGPKGYQRSDERIREEICEMLSRQGRIDASEVDVKVAGGEVTLTGTVMQRGDKLDIEHIVEHVSGVKDVKNEIRRAPLSSGQSMHTGNLTGATNPNPGGSPSASSKGTENGNKNPTTRHSS